MYPLTYDGTTLMKPSLVEPDRSAPRQVSRLTIAVTQGLTRTQPGLRRSRDARQATKCQEREAVRGLEEDGDVEGARGRIANSPDASRHGGEQSGSGGDTRQGGTTAQKKAAGRKGGKATAQKH